MDVQQAIERGIAAARANNQPTAYYYFYSATQADPTNEQAWLWRASTALHPRDALYCLAAVLALNPNNPVARHGLEQISAAVAAETAPEAVSVTPSLSSGEYKPPVRRLEWQQSFQRDLYDLAHVPRMEHAAGDAADDGATSVPVEVESIAYRRPPRAGQRLVEAVRRVFVDRDTQRVQFAIPVVIAVVLLIGGVALLGLGQLNNPIPPGPPPTAGSAPPATPTVSSGSAITPTVAGVASATLVAGTHPTPVAASPTAAPPSVTTLAASPTLPVETPTGAPAPATAPPAATVTAPEVPTATAPPPPPPSSTAIPPTDTPAPPPATATPAQQTITVAAGQTLPALAQQHGVSVAALWAYNDLTNVRDVQAGTTLKLPPAGYQAPGEVRYVIQVGDAVFNIAQLFGTTVPAIAARNGMTNAGQILVGQTLIIPVP